MEQYVTYVRDFAPFVGPMHVVTETSERNPERPYYFEAEDKARAAGNPVRLLHDADGSLGLQYGPSVSPFVMVLDRTGQVLVEGDLSGTDVWRAIIAANRY
jgi:hypothetical protein